MTARAATTPTGTAPDPATAPATAPTGYAGRALATVFGALMLGMFLAALDQTIVSAILTGGMVLLAELGVSTPGWLASVYMLVVGVGLGLVMQVLVLVVQNDAPDGDIGTATSSATCFRSVGGAFGVAVFRAIFTSRLSDRLVGLPAAAAARLGGGVHLNPEQASRLPPEIHARFLGALPTPCTGCSCWGRRSARSPSGSRGCSRRCLCAPPSTGWRRSAPSTRRPGRPRPRGWSRWRTLPDPAERRAGHQRRPTRRGSILVAVTGSGAPEEIVPRLRGVSHAVGFVAALAAAAVIVGRSPGGKATAALAVYGAGLVALFGGSALYHRWPGPKRFKPLLRRIDHSTIFVFIAASYTPLAAILIPGAVGWLLLIGAWAGALLGVAFSLGWIDASRGVITASYCVLGWLVVIAVPELLRILDPTPVLLFAAGGVLYTVGAVIYARRRPNPWPQTFGFHEIFHVLVIAAAAVHYVAMIGWVLPASRA